MNTEKTLGTYLRSDQYGQKQHHPNRSTVQCPDVCMLTDEGRKIHLRELCQQRRNGLILVNIPRLEHPSTPMLLSQLAAIDRTALDCEMSICALCTESPQELRAYEHQTKLPFSLYSARHHVYEFSMPIIDTMQHSENFNPLAVYLDENGHILDIQLIHHPEALSAAMTRRLRSLWM